MTDYMIFFCTFASRFHSEITKRYAYLVSRNVRNFYMGQESVIILAYSVDCYGYIFPKR